MAAPLIHRHESALAGTPVNAYLVEGRRGVVAVDATLTVAGGRALREHAESLGKPLVGAVLTHVHPDHYGGLGHLIAGRDIPVYATQAVHDVVRRDDPLKEQILRPMFGDEWPHERAFPNRVVADGATVDFGDFGLTVTDLGPSESPADSMWALADDPRRVFSADLVYNRKHCYLADGFHVEWLANITRAREELPAGTTLHPGHGDPAGLELLDWQQGYIENMVAAAEDADPVARMHEYLPNDELAFLMELSVDPLRARLASRAGAPSPTGRSR
jgi:glyoxylase-like metal-dependent hydrolase (beta-lactamase superfamily II)